MKKHIRSPLSLLAIFGILIGMFLDPRTAKAERPEVKEVNRLYNQGNYNDAYILAKKTLLDSEPDGDEAYSTESAGLLSTSIQSLQNLSRIEEMDKLLESVIARYPRDWRVLRSAAVSYTNQGHEGYYLSGAFVRGWPRGGQVEYANAFARDRVRSIQVFLKAISAAEGQARPDELYSLYMQVAEQVKGHAAWKLQVKTDLETLPDYDAGYSYQYNNSDYKGAPVTPSGEPVYYKVPQNFESAQNDGERWRFLLEQAGKVYPASSDSCKWQFLQFLDSQFGVKTLLADRIFQPNDDESKAGKAGIYSLKTLQDTETIARLANGIRRFTLPQEFNPVILLQELASSSSGYKQSALEALAQVYEDRQQYPRAAEYWRKAIELGGPGTSLERQKRLDQIVGAWGEFEPLRSQAAGSPGSFEFRFRNATSVSFEAYEIELSKLLQDTKEYLRGNPRELDWQEINIENIGQRILLQHQEKYKGKKVADWKLALLPREEHFSKRITVESPLQKAGAYFLKAKVAAGNEVFAVLWLNDTAVVKKSLDQGTMYYLADAKTGKPLPEMKLDFFGYQQKWTDKTLFGGRASNILTLEKSADSDSNGMFVAEPSYFDTGYQWMMIARDNQGKGERLAFLGFQGVWTGRYYDSEYNQTKPYGISDRPVYRPEQKMQYKVWVRHAKYDIENEEMAARSVTLLLSNPKGEKISEQTVTLDRFGGVEGSYEIPKGAPLGIYRLQVVGIGQAMSFRVEEYKKPEFEVVINAPREPLMLGEKISASIQSKYYFGSPVSKAKVHYKVVRNETETNWYPRGLWDWFYGPGYWWYAYDYRWYPGWAEWGCKAPHFIWMWYAPANPPELVQEGEVEIRPDGTLPIEIDTTLAKELHGDTDHKYEITAEVTDDSRRMIVGTGSVYVARKPFKVYTWVDRGYYRSGEVVHAEFSAQTPDSKPVQGSGKVKLYSLSYNAKREPIEKELQSWDLDTKENGFASLDLKAARLGQYRLSYTLQDKANHSIEGAYIFTVIGENLKGSEFRFNDIELIPEKREYAPGEKVQLQINTDQADSHVLLFLRPANSVYRKPELLSLKGKTSIQSVEVSKKDMPNFFVEAVTVHDGQVYTQVKEIQVPPEKRVLNVEVLPSAEKYKPGQEAEVQLKVTDYSGKPFSGTAVLSVYDKSVEYISGGSNVPEIKQFFWKWRRTHRQSGVNNLLKITNNLYREDAQVMSALGVFGGSEMDALQEEQSAVPQGAVKSSLAPSSRRMQAGSTLADGDFLGAAVAKEKGAMKNEAAAPSMAMDAKKDRARDDESAQGAGAEQVQATVRTEFADTAYWDSSVEVDSEGKARLHFKMPENLTGWKFRTWVLGEGTRVGEGSAEAVTTKNLVLRAQAPRFLVEKDEVVLSANIHNFLSTKKAISAKLELPGKELELLEEGNKNIEIAAGEEKRVDWRVKVKAEGQATIRMSALGNEESDAMEIHLPVYVHGMLKTDSFSGAMRPEDTRGSIDFQVPAERRPEQSRLEVRYSPSLAGALVDALPYLVNFPYGCTEQTLNRFLPTAITQKILRELKVDLKKVREKRSNLNAQEIGDAKERAKQWQRYRENPVFDEDMVHEMAQSGLERLLAMQLSNGGWGWFSGYGETASPHLSAYVVHGLRIALENDLEVPPSALSRGIAYLQSYEAEQLQMLKNAKTKTNPYKEVADNLDVFIHMVLLDEKSGHAEMRDFLYRDRNSLSLYAKAMEGLIFFSVGDKEKVAMLRKNIEQFLVVDNENQTAYLKLGNEGYWWYWYGSEYEAHAYYLKLLSKIDPKGETAPKLVKYLLNNRKNATYWNSTRDTAIVIESFADYLKASGELAPDLDIEIYLDGKKQKEVKVNGENLFDFDSSLLLVGDQISAGKHHLEFKKKGKGPLYFNAYVTNFTLEDPIQKAGLEVKVERKYYKLLRDENATTLAEGGNGEAISQKVEKHKRVPLESQAQLLSGDLVEVELDIESKNDYEYLLFEDMKPAGFEPLEVRSGYNGNALGAYVEFRDERVAFFARTLPRGARSVSYRLRAEVPGKFSALPTRASAMYAPELKGNSSEFKTEVKDR